MKLYKKDIPCPACENYLFI